MGRKPVSERLEKFTTNLAPKDLAEIQHIGSFKNRTSADVGRLLILRALEIYRQTKCVTKEEEEERGFSVHVVKVGTRREAKG